MLSTAALALTLFPFAQGTYEGDARCRNGAGQEMVYAQTLEISGTTFKTTITATNGVPSPAGADEVFVKTATFAENGFFTWSGPEVKQGEGYCTSRGLCHWDMTFAPAGQEPFAGEDTMTRVEGGLVIIGSVTIFGDKYVCEEIYEGPKG